MFVQTQALQSVTKNVSPINSQNSGPKECKKKKDRKSTPHIHVPLALALHLIPGGWGRPCEVSDCGECSAMSVEGDRFAISSSWYRKASAVVVHWRCWLVHAIPRHQAQVYSKITFHACHDCTVATSKFQPFHTFQRSTKTHRRFLLVFAVCSAA